MTESKYSVTLTGKVQAGRDAPTVWERVSLLLKLDALAFGERVLARVPVTLKAVDREDAERQLEALTSCGADAVMLEEEAAAPRLWVRIEQSTRGPLSTAYARHALREGVLQPHTQACPQDDKQWQALSALLQSIVVPEAAPRTPEAAMTSPVAGAATPGVLKLLPTHREQRDLHAGFWLRVVGYLIDALILLLPLLLIDYMVFGRAIFDRDADSSIKLYRTLMDFLLAWPYFAFFEASPLQATPGKLALGLCVTDECGRRIGFWRATGRYCGKLVSALILLMGYAMAGFTERKQALHDVLAGCLVVRKSALGARALAADAPRRARTGMPGWAIALIAVGVSIVPIALLAVIAIPAYQQYVLRTQVMEGAQLAAMPKAAVARYMLQRDTPPQDNAAVGLDAAASITGRYVDQVKVDYGDVRVHFSDRAAEAVRDRHLLFTPQLSHGVVVWKCLSPDLPHKLLPRTCR